MWFSVSFEESLDFHKWLGSSGNSFFFREIVVRSKHLTRTSRTLDASIHSDLFLGTGRFLGPPFGRHGRFSLVVSRQSFGEGRSLQMDPLVLMLGSSERLSLSPSHFRGSVARFGAPLKRLARGTQLRVPSGKLTVRY